MKGINYKCVELVKNEIHSHKIFLKYLINILIDGMLSEPFYLFSQESKLIPIIIDAYQKLKRDAMPIDK